MTVRGGLQAVQSGENGLADPQGQPILFFLLRLFLEQSRVAERTYDGLL